MNSLLKVVTSSVHSQHVSRLLHITSMVSIDIKWRRSQRLPEHIKKEPEFYDRPDYSFLDGRPTPLGQDLLTRYNDEKRLAEDAIMYLGEINHAVKKYNMKKVQAEEYAQAILSRKLKPKGPAYRPKDYKKQKE